MEIFAHAETWISLATLTLLEIVLGIDNIVFISILAGKLPHAQQARARNLGLLLAMASRIGLLTLVVWVAHLQQPITPPLFGHAFSGRDLILLGGGIFLIFKATHEIHSKLEGGDHTGGTSRRATFGGVIVQILAIDLVFSLDSVITAIGVADHLAVMMIAVVLSVIFMLIFAGAVSHFVNRHPTVKMLALSFLLLIGFTLVVESLHVHIPKGYIYFAMAFSLGVELLNLRLRAKGQPVPLHGPAASGSAR